MSEVDDRIHAMQSKFASIEADIRQRHAFALQVFSCVIDLYGLAVNLYDNMPEDFERQRFREGLSTLAESVNEAQKLSNSIEGSSGSVARGDG